MAQRWQEVPNGLVVNEEFSCLYRGIRHTNIPSFLTTETRIISKVVFVCVCLFVLLKVATSAFICQISYRH